jgi:hypothetical protein
MPSRDRPSPTPLAEPPSLELVLAAVDRAVRHGPRHGTDAPRWSILEHLEIPRRSRGARLVTPQLERLEASGLLQRSRRRGGAPGWSPTASGLRRLRDHRLAGCAEELPESPQHRAWRGARTAAAQEIERFRRRLEALLDEAEGLLQADPPPSSDAWFALAESLRDAVRRVGSATYCLREWVEPDEQCADIDEHTDPADERLDPAERVRVRARRLGRRNVWLWGERPRG